jgi:hypothetical protein
MLPWQLKTTGREVRHCPVGIPFSVYRIYPAKERIEEQEKPTWFRNGIAENGAKVKKHHCNVYIIEHLLQGKRIKKHFENSI